MPSEPRSPGTRASRRTGTRADDVWTPGTLHLVEGERPGAAALEVIAGRTQPEPEPEPAERVGDERTFAELADELAAFNEPAVEPDDEDDE